MEQGWIKLHRKTLKWEWFHDANTLKVFLYLLLSANHEDKKWQGIVIKRGSIVTSLPNLSRDTKLTLQQTRTALDKLKSTCEITCSNTNKYTLISIVNYSGYQENNTQDNIQITGQQHSNNIQITSTKELKNIRTKELKKDICKEKISLIYPEWLNLELWNEFKIYRAFEKSKNPIATENLNLNKLIKLKDLGHNPDEVINQTIEKGWTGLFPVKDQQQVGHYGNKGNLSTGEKISNQFNEMFGSS